MSRTSRFQTSLLLGAMALVTAACSSEPGAASTEAAANDQALCSNVSGVNAVMTGIAVAAGMEMHRWLPLRDFAWDGGSGRLIISNYGSARCANHSCPNTQALLALQGAAANTVEFPGNIYLDAGALRAALKSNWDQQVACVNSGACPQEPFDLAYTNVEAGSCDVKYFFNVYPQGGSDRITDTARLEALEDNLIFLGYPENRMLNFYIRSGQVSIDPTGGLDVGSATVSGSCTANCVLYTTSDMRGDCCSCNGTNSVYSRSILNANLYLCR